MVFNTWDYVVFFVVFYALYLSLRRYQWQNWLLLIASYYFYAAWDWRFAVLMLASTVVDYVVGLQMYRCSGPLARKVLLLVSMVFSLSMLGFFKYYNFFLDSLTSLLAPLGLTPHAMHLDIILPFGISFYTFQTMSYTIDIYRRELVPTRNFRDFALFVAFFPHLVAGPIMRAADLIPQFTRPRSLNQPQFAIACWLIGWGLWKKIFVADNMALLANPVFAHSASVTWLEAYLALAYQLLHLAPGLSVHPTRRQSVRDPPDLSQSSRDHGLGRSLAWCVLELHLVGHLPRLPSQRPPTPDPESGGTDGAEFALGPFLRHLANEPIDAFRLAPLPEYTEGHVRGQDHR